MPYKFLEGLTVADVAFQASGKTLEQMFESAALATIRTQVKDLKAIKQKVKKEIKLEADSVERLLFDFLQELIFYKDAELLLFNKFEIKITEKYKKYFLTATASGEKLNMKKHELLVDVKAVTMHKFEVKKTKTGWAAVVVLDI